ncbi:hypothetical protein CES86_0089 [Brucella lupini]|uniref:Uncharacterized protein n=1 Tax=Brucella lupini TaxID=255457 RepID=A0A256GZ39_9HYPH|nr:hypothetical protein CES86_0089 [Brucella lupini]
MCTTVPKKFDFDRMDNPAAINSTISAVGSEDGLRQNRKP